MQRPNGGYQDLGVGILIPLFKVTDDYLVIIGKELDTTIIAEDGLIYEIFVSKASNNLSSGLTAPNKEFLPRNIRKNRGWLLSIGMGVILNGNKIIDKQAIVYSPDEFARIESKIEYEGEVLDLIVLQTKD